MLRGFEVDLLESVTGKVTRFESLVSGIFLLPNPEMPKAADMSYQEELM